MTKIFILYDSQYGNTEQIARAVADGLKDKGEVNLVRVGEVKPGAITGVSLLIVGTPTQRFNATPAISNLLKSLPSNSLRGVRVAAFDTRLSQGEIQKTPALAFFVRLWGKGAYGAKHIADLLKKLGGELAAPPEGFLVEGMQGPLAPGELERAGAWVNQIVK